MWVPLGCGALTLRLLVEVVFQPRDDEGAGA